MQIRLSTTITAPPPASWGLTGEGDRDPGDKGGKKQLIQGGDVMRCVFKWMCNKNIFCHWMNGGRFNWISRDRRTGTEWFWQERTAQRSNYSMFTFRMKHLQVQKVVWPNNVVERSQKRRRDGEICHQRFRKKRFCPFFTPWRVNNRICSVISLPYVFSPLLLFLNPAGNQAALFTERWRLKSERRPLRPTHSSCPPLEASDISVLERSNWLMRFGSRGTQRISAVKRSVHKSEVWK